MKFLKLVFERFLKCGVKLFFGKEHILSQRIEILGHNFSPEGIIADPDKIKAVPDIPILQNNKQL